MCVSSVFCINLPWNSTKLGFWQDQGITQDPNENDTSGNAMPRLQFFSPSRRTFIDILATMDLQNGKVFYTTIIIHNPYKFTGKQLFKNYWSSMIFLWLLPLTALSKIKAGTESAAWISRGDSNPSTSDRVFPNSMKTFNRCRVLVKQLPEVVARLSGNSSMERNFNHQESEKLFWYPIEKGTPILSNVFNPFIYRLVWLLNPENRRFRCTTLVYANNNPSSFWPRLSHQCVVEELEAPWLGVWFWRGIVNGTGDSWKHTFLVDGFAKWTSESWRTFHP